MSILSALKQQSGSIDDLAKLPQTMIMQMAQRKEIVPEMVPAILAKKAEMIDRAAKMKASQGGVPQQSIMDQIMAKNAQAENPQAMGQMPPPMPQQNQMAQPPQQPQQPPQSPADVGIASNPVPPMQLAGGGIIAFAEGKEVKKPIATDYQAEIKAALDAQKTFNPTEKSDLMAQQYAEELKNRQGNDNNTALLNTAAGMLAGESPYFFTNVGKGAQEGVKSLAASNLQNQTDRKMLLQNQIEGEKFKEQRRVGGLNALIQAQAAIDAKKLGMEQIKASYANAASAKEAALINAAATQRQNWIEKRANHLMQDSIKKFQYNGNSNLALIDAAQEHDLIAPDSQLKLLGLTRPSVDAPANPNIPKPVSAPVIVVVPPINGQPAQSLQFKDQASADAFKASPKYKELVTPK
jgi:hypothetical protein